MLYVTSETSDIYPQNTHPVVKRLNKTSNLHPFNVQYSLFDTEKKTGTKLYAKILCAYVKYFSP